MANRSGPHSQLRRTVIEYLRMRGAWTIAVMGGIGIRAGCPDILACLNGRMVACELKTGNATLRPNQLREREDLQRAGALWILVHDLEDVEDALYDAGLIPDRAIMVRKRA